MSTHSEDPQTDRRQPIPPKMMSSKVTLQLEGIEKSYAGVRALDGASLTIRSGEIHALIGENGSGKSTLIRIIAGVATPDRGSIQVGGLQLERLHPLQSIDHGIRVIYQDFALFPNLSVAENLALSRLLAEKRKLFRPPDAARIATAALRALDLQLDLETPVERLPVASRQMIAICRALDEEARLIIMDEPTTSLSRKEVEALFEVVDRLRQHDVAVLFVSHRIDDVCRISDRITVLRNGRVVGELERGQFNAGDLACLMTGRSPGSFRAQQDGVSRSAQPSRVQVLDLECAPHFREVSFQLAPGEILGLTGPLGSGQIAVGLSLFGLLPAHTGLIRLDGQALRLQRTSEAIAAGIGYVPEDRHNEGLFPGHSVDFNISVGLLRQYSSKGRLLDRRSLRSRAAREAALVGIAETALDRPVRELSGGNQQRVMLARWLSMSPRFLVLTNPTAGVDVACKFELHRLFRQKSEQGMSILWISDDLPELLENCSRILIMRQGKIVEELASGGLTESQLYQRVVG